MFFNINEFQAVFIFYPIVNFIIGVIIAVISLFLLVFIDDMTPDKFEERVIIEQAEEYLEEHYDTEEYEIYDVLYDNMGNYTLFDYAAKVRNSTTGEEFLIYYNKQANQMEDSLRYELE